MREGRGIEGRERRGSEYKKGMKAGMDRKWEREGEEGREGGRREGGRKEESRLKSVEPHLTSSIFSLYHSLQVLANHSTLYMCCQVLFVQPQNTIHLTRIH